MEIKTLTEYRRPKFVVVSVQTIEVIASSPELDLSTTPYDEEEW